MSSLGRSAAFAWLFACYCCHAAAQSSLPPSRQIPIRYDGWSAASATPSTTTAAAPNEREEPRDHRDLYSKEPVAQVAYFQSQGSLSDLPELPVLPAGALPGRIGAQQPLASLPDYTRENANSAAGNGQVLPPPSQVLPPQNDPRAYGADAAKYSGQGVDLQSNDGRRPAPQPRERPLSASAAGFQQNVGQSSGNAELRPIDPTLRTGQGQAGGTGQNQFANGLPFVTPPPRTGRYPTSPYIGPRYQLTNYQLRTIPAQTVSTQNGLSVPDAMAAAAQPQVLPQDRNVVGVYPTAYQQCAPGSAVNYPATGAVPGTYVPPTYPANLTPGLYSPNNSGYAPLFSLGQENYNVMLGRGLIGQPTVYVPGQPFRNFFRYISP